MGTPQLYGVHVKAPDTCENADELVEAAKAWQRTAPRTAEFNFPATAIMAVQMALDASRSINLVTLTRALRDCETSSESGMLQLAFLNMGINPGASFITVATADGWRYRIGKGFHRLPQEAKELVP